MISTLFTATPTVNASTQKWSLASLIRTLLHTRQEVRRIAVLAERERLKLGYQRIPQRVWDRHSALFIDR